MEKGQPITIELSSGEIIKGKFIRIATDGIWGKRRKAEPTLHFTTTKDGSDYEGACPMREVISVK